MNWSNVKKIIIPEGIVTKIEKDSLVLWGWSLGTAEAISNTLSETFNSCLTYVKNFASAIGVGLSSSASSGIGLTQPGIRAVSNSISSTLNQLSSFLKTIKPAISLNTSTSTTSLTSDTSYVPIKGKSNNASVTTQNIIARWLLSIIGDISKNSISNNNASIGSKYRASSKIDINSISNSDSGLNSENILPGESDGSSDSSHEMNLTGYISSASKLDNTSVVTDTNSIGIWTLPKKEDEDLAVQNAYTIVQTESNLTLG